MDKRKTKFMAPSQTPVFPQTLHTLRPNREVMAPKNTKQDNIFSRSRDKREDRGSRQMKTSHNTKTFLHIRSSR